MLKYICYPKCTTCLKAKAFLDEYGAVYETRDVKSDKPSYDELKKWLALSGLPVRKFFNTSGLLYKSLSLKNKLPSMSEDECLKLLATDGMLVKRPLLVNNDGVLVGFHRVEWESAIARYRCGGADLTKSQRLLCKPVAADAPGAQNCVIAENPSHRQKPEFRFAARGDAPLVLDFIKKLAEYEKMLNEVTVTPELLEYWLFDNHAAEVMFAVVDGKEVGFALYFISYSTFLGKAGLYLEDLYVPPEHRGRGIGKAILAELARIALERGYGRMEWACLDWNEASIGFFRSIGAAPMSEWTTYRLTGDSLARLSDGRINQRSLK